MTRKKKQITIFSFLVIIIAAVCISIYIVNVNDRHNEPIKQTVTSDIVTKKIIANMKYTDITKIQENQLTKHYDIPDGLVSDFSIYMSKSANQSFEIACFELTDKNNFEQLKQIIAEHVAARAESFKEQSPAEYEKIQKYALTHKEKFVFMAISSDADAAAATFTSIVG